jgi:hypothetical protein
MSDMPSGLGPAAGVALLIAAPVPAVAAPVEPTSQASVEASEARGRSTIWIILLLTLVAGAALLAGGGKGPCQPVITPG